MFLVIKFWCEKNILSRQNFGHDKHTFVATKDVFVAKKTFVATKMILVAAPASDVCEQQQYENCGVAVNQLSLLGWSQRHANKLTSDT